MNCLTQGIELNKLIPAIRKEFIKILEKGGLNDSEIADKLKITKSAISQYKHKKRGKNIDFPKHLENLVRKSAEKILVGKSADAEINFLLNQMKKQRFTCNVCGECMK